MSNSGQLLFADVYKNVFQFQECKHRGYFLFHRLQKSFYKGHPKKTRVWTHVNKWEVRELITAIKVLKFAPLHYQQVTEVF